MRIISLGGSSTFGFYNRDPYTYPSILERLLVETLGNQTVEVINAGIPHANSDNLAAMLKEELLNYNPDVITIYSGYNDAGWVMDTSSLHTFLRWMHFHSATYVALKRLISATGGPELYSRYAKHRSNRDYVRRQVELQVNRFDRNIREIISYAQRNRIGIIFIKQPINMSKNQNIDSVTKLTYNERVTFVQRRLEEDSFVSGNEVTLLIHYALINTLWKVANEKNIPVVDNISIVDQHSEYLASYVHLTEDGNRALAEALHDAIIPLIATQNPWIMGF